MAIRERWHRMIRKSVSSSSSSGGNTSSTATDDGTDSTTQPLSKASSGLSMISRWRSDKSSSKDMPKEKSPKPPRQKVKLHPSERPLTETNLRHQEILGTFTMKFGHSRVRRLSRGQSTCYSGISPGNSRPGSVDHSSAYDHRRISSSVTACPPRLMPPDEVESELERDETADISEEELGGQPRHSGSRMSRKSGGKLSLFDLKG